MQSTHTYRYILTMFVSLLLCTLFNLISASHIDNDRRAVSRSYVCIILLYVMRKIVFVCLFVDKVLRQLRVGKEMISTLLGCCLKYTYIYRYI